MKNLLENKTIEILKYLEFSKSFFIFALSLLIKTNLFYE